MRLTSDELDPIWSNAYAMHLGPPPYQLVMAAARLVGDRATHVLAEASVSDEGTSWRLLWLTDLTMGVATAASEVVNWKANNASSAAEPEVRASIQPLSDCRRITYVQTRSHSQSFGPVAEFSAHTAITLHFDDYEVALDPDRWTHGDRDKLDEVQAVVVERWSKLR